MAVLVATDFFTVEVLTLRGLITYYVLFFIHLESRRICLAGVTRHPNQEWMEQMARNVTSMPPVCWEGQLCVSREFVTINSRCMDFLRSTTQIRRNCSSNYTFASRLGRSDATCLSTLDRGNAFLLNIG